MVQKSYLLFALMLIPGLLLATPSDPAKCRIENLPIITGNEIVNQPVAYPPSQLPPPLDGIDVIGDTLTVGTTWYESQHNGTIGRMIVKDDSGYIHFVWMNGLEDQAINRHVYYNFIDPTGVQGWPQTGYAVESSVRAGFTTLDVDYGGIAFPAFHQQTTGANFHTAVAHDFFPHAGAFLITEPDWLYDPAIPPPSDMELIWPRIQFDRNQAIHVIATENPWTAQPGDPQRQYYTQGTYDPGTFTITFPTSPDSTWQEISWTMTIAADLATSEVSDRVAFAWTWCRDDGFPGGDPSQRNNDIYVLIDDDGQDFHFGDYFNLTQFIPPDISWYPDTLKADMDTLRAYTDLNIFIDQDDWVHVTFTTPSYFELEGTTYWHASLVWHWSEQFPGEFQLIHNAFDDWWLNYTNCGAWQVKAQRPSLGQDPSTGYLYCMYHVYDCDTVSAAGWPSGEVYVSMSPDGGANWSVGTNVTSTISPPNAQPYQCLSELTPTMAKLVDGTCHIMYVLDVDAGNIAQTEGSWTLNPVKYHSVPVGEINTTQWVPQWPEPGSIPFHVEHGTWPDVPGVGRYKTPKSFALQQNYPNPFNPTTSISFSLDEVSDVSLLIYNLKGEVVAKLTSGTYGTGQHTVTFDGSDLASGIYIYKLEAGDRTLVRKMLLLK